MGVIYKLLSLCLFLAYFNFEKIIKNSSRGFSDPRVIMSFNASKMAT